MTDVAIHTNFLGLVAVDAPSHGLVYDAPHTVHLADRPVTSCAVDPSLNVRLVCVIRVRFRFDPVHALPGRLFFSRRERRELLNFRALGLDRFVATHAGVNVGNSCVSRLIDVLMAEGAFKLGSFVARFGYVLPVIELDRLNGRFGSSRGSQQKEAEDCDHRDCQHYEFRQSSHPSG